MQSSVWQLSYICSLISVIPCLQALPMSLFWVRQLHDNHFEIGDIGLILESGFAVFRCEISIMKPSDLAVCKGCELTRIC